MSDFIKVTGIQREAAGRARYLRLCHELRKLGMPLQTTAAVVSNLNYHRAGPS